MRAYLDHNATTPIRPDVVIAMVDTMAAVGNPSSVHTHGQKARKAVERARTQVGRAICARPDDVIFTSGGTEATNLALHSVIEAGGARRLIVSAIEHSAIAEIPQAAGLEFDVLPVDGDGVVDLGWLKRRLADWDTQIDGVPVLALMLVNNEIGTIQPVAEAANLMHDAGGLLVVDAIQAVGKIGVDFAALGADYLALSSHKFGGPQGAGALVVACNAQLARHHHGGGQEKGRRAGTENVAGIVGLGLAIEQSVAQLDHFAGLSGWRDEIINEIRLLAPEAVILGEGAARLPNTVSLSIPGWKRENQVMALDLDGVSISAGSACSSGKSRGSKVGTALGLDDDVAEGVVRISLGWNSTRDDLVTLLVAWKRAYQRVAPSLKLTA
jgi:cysteine desulfurase